MSCHAQQCPNFCYFLFQIWDYVDVVALFWVELMQFLTDSPLLWDLEKTEGSQ